MSNRHARKLNMRLLLGGLGCIPAGVVIMFLGRGNPPVVQGALWKGAIVLVLGAVLFYLSAKEMRSLKDDE